MSEVQTMRVVDGELVYRRVLRREYPVGCRVRSLEDGVRGEVVAHVDGTLRVEVACDDGRTREMPVSRIDRIDHIERAEREGRFGSLR